VEGEDLECEKPHHPCSPATPFPVPPAKGQSQLGKVRVGLAPPAKAQGRKQTQDRGEEEERSGRWAGRDTALLCPPPSVISFSRQGVGTHCPVTDVSKGRSQERQWK
jgi:hypothetical protein